MIPAAGFPNPSLILASLSVCTSAGTLIKGQVGICFPTSGTGPVTLNKKRERRSVLREPQKL